MGRNIQRLLGGIESGLYQTEAGFIPEGAARVPEGTIVTHKEDPAAGRPMRSAASVIVSDGKSFLGMLFNPVIKALVSFDQAYIVGGNTSPDNRYNYQSYEGKSATVLLGPAQVAITNEVYVGTPAAPDILFVTSEGKLTATYKSVADATGGNVVVGRCEVAAEAGDTTGIIRILLFSPHASYA